MPQRSVQKPKSMISSKFDGEKPLYIFNITRTYTERQNIVLLGIKFCSFYSTLWILGVFVFVTKALRRGGKCILYRFGNLELQTWQTWTLIFVLAAYLYIRDRFSQATNVRTPSDTSTKSLIAHEICTSLTNLHRTEVLLCRFKLF